MEAIVLPLVEKEFTGLIMQFLCIFYFFLQIWWHAKFNKSKWDLFWSWM